MGAPSAERNFGRLPPGEGPEGPSEASTRAQDSCPPAGSDLLHGLPPKARSPTLCANSPASSRHPHDKGQSLPSRSPGDRGKEKTRLLQYADFAAPWAPRGGSGTNPGRGNLLTGVLITPQGKPSGGCGTWGAQPVHPRLRRRMCAMPAVS